MGVGAQILLVGQVLIAGRAPLTINQVAGDQNEHEEVEGEADVGGAAAGAHHWDRGVMAGLRCRETAIWRLREH